MSSPQIVIDKLRELRHVEHIDAAFWQQLLHSVLSLCLSRSALIIEKRENKDTDFHVHAAILDDADDQDAILQSPWLEALLQRAKSNRFALGKPSHANDVLRLAVPLAGVQNCYLLLIIAADAANRVNDIVVRAQLIADIPLNGRAVDKAATGHETATQVLGFLDLLAEIYQAPRFPTAAYALANGLVSHSEAIDQTVIGWSEGRYLKVRAVSHMDRFERKTELIKSFEAAMEEAFDQQQAISLQPDSSSSTKAILLAHRQLQIDHGCKSLFSLPLMSDQGGEGLVILLISYEQPIPPDVQAASHFLGKVIFPRLEHLRKLEQPFPMRWWRGLRRGLGWVLGPEHVWSKVFSCVITGLLLYGLLGTLPHRIEGSASLVTDNIRIAGAPFDGRVDEALVANGEVVEQGNVLLLMDRQDLLLQQAEVRADLLRNQSETSRARAMMDLVETEISRARSAQSEARLQRLAVYLQQSEVRAPFDGVVIEGDRQELLGSSVSQGDLLYRVARLDDLYLDITVSQQDIHYIEEGERGEFTFASRPDVRVPFTVRRIIPVATVEDNSGPAFRVKADIEQPPENWWRPGMEGIAKVDQGNRNVFWVISHRLIDRIRLWLWW